MNLLEGWDYDALFGPREGGVRPLEGGITNRNFLVNFGGDEYVVRLPGGAVARVNPVSGPAGAAAGDVEKLGK